MISEESHDLALQSQNLLSTEEEMQLEARRKVSKHLRLANLIEE
jgi:hypothetical protein